MIDRKAVAGVLEEIAACLELKGVEPYRARAYKTAARAVAQYGDDLRDALRDGTLAELKGVGPATLEVIAEVLETGRSRMLEQLRDEIPSGLVEMLRIPGLGVAKVRQIFETLRVDTLDELEEAARDGRLAQLPRFGPKLAEKVLKGIYVRRTVSEFRLLHHARAEAADLASALARLPGVERVAVAGSARRGRELVRDLDLVALIGGRAEELIHHLGTLAGVRETEHRGTTSLALRFASGTAVDVYFASAADFGFQLIRATGSMEHLEHLARRASERGLTWTERGLEREGEVVSAPEEETVYRLLDMRFVPPELREGAGEVEAAAADALPCLVSLSDLQGFLHCHSDYSDGASTIREWADACQAAGYSYLGLTDHSPSTAYAGGLAEEDVPRQHREIELVNAALQGFRVLKGVEADIRPDGSLDYSPAVRRSFDFVIASLHTHHGMDERAMTERVLRAFEHPEVTILGHPTARLLLSREPFPLDLDTIFSAAAERGIAIEINADPQRLDLDWRLVRRAAEAGVAISIGADAHSVAGMRNMELGITIARKGWLSADRILNARGPEEFLAFAAARRGGR